MGSLSLLQGIFPNQGLNPSLPHCRWILYQLSHKGSPRILEWVPSSFSRRSFQPRYPLPSPGDLSNPGIKSRSPALQADSLPAEPQRKLKNTGVGSLSLLQWIFWTQESNWGLLHCRWIPDQLTYQGIPKKILSSVKWPFLPFIRNQ